MITDIQARGFGITNALAQHVRHSLDGALQNKYPHISKLKVRLSDINGPRGGEDKCCQIFIGLPHLKDVVVADTDADMYAAVTHAVDRASIALNRRLSRRRSLNHKRTWHATTAEDISTPGHEH